VRRNIDRQADAAQQQGCESEDLPAWEHGRVCTSALLKVFADIPVVAQRVIVQSAGCA
jgi:hypothetical protein